MSVLILQISLLTPLIPFWPKGLTNFSLFLLGEAAYGVKYFSGTHLLSYKEYALGPVCLSTAGINNRPQRSRPWSSQPSAPKLFLLTPLRSSHLCLLWISSRCLHLFSHCFFPMLGDAAQKFSTNPSVVAVFNPTLTCLGVYKPVHCLFFNFCRQGSARSQGFPELFFQLSLNQRKTNGNYLTFSGITYSETRILHGRSQANKWSHISGGISWKPVPVCGNLPI